MRNQEGSDGAATSVANHAPQLAGEPSSADGPPPGLGGGVVGPSSPPLVFGPKNSGENFGSSPCHANSWNPQGGWVRPVGAGKGRGGSVGTVGTYIWDYRSVPNYGHDLPGSSSAPMFTGIA